jgi:hypothetical protein
MALNADHYAIVIGIKGYSQLRPLKGAESDAVAFGRWVTSEEGGGVPLENYEIILSPTVNSNNPFDARPIQLEIDAALTRFGIERNERLGKRLYFYFSGHGFGPEYNEVGMLLANASLTRLGYSLGLQPYRELFRKMEAFDEVVFILDCCRDPNGGFTTLKPPFHLPGRSDETKFQDLVVLGARYGEQSFQPLDPEFKGTGERRGLLTKALIEGLTLPEAADGLGRFTSSSLSYWVKQKVRELAKDALVDQTPNIDDTYLRENIVFATIPDSKLERVKVSIVAPPGLAGTLLLLDSFGNELARQPAADAAPPDGWPVTLIRNRWYDLKLLPPKAGTKPNIIDLTGVNADTHVYEFKP